ncbi:MAG: hypothetical protein KDN22_30200 [Verrucomicrobiae bacterium]|nr:hypothetical protein [Verrucomicrobiae bacterium]
MHSATLLRDGRILIVGGQDSKGKFCDAEFFTP